MNYPRLQVTKVFVLHVKKGYEERLQSIAVQLNLRGIDFELVLDGDMEDISPERLDKYFSGNMHRIAPVTSCALKHLLAYESIVSNDYEDALIFEDDAILHRDFNTIFNHTIEELRERLDVAHENIIVSYENSTLKLVPRKQRVKDKYLYNATENRCAGAYYLNKVMANNILQYVYANKCSIPIDWYHGELGRNMNIRFQWCQPPIVEQGSHNGMFSSGIDNKTGNIWRNVTWKIKMLYKRIVT